MKRCVAGSLLLLLLALGCSPAKVVPCRTTLHGHATVTHTKTSLVQMGDTWYPVTENQYETVCVPFARRDRL